MVGEQSQKIVLKHLTGSKANQIEPLLINGIEEITIGRDPRSTIAFDAAGDDVVSRNHAAIVVSPGPNRTFTIEDRGSSNGTYLNGERLTGKSELMPDDAIALGKGGPSFVFDIQPRPPGLSPRTRVLNAAVGATRVMNAQDAARATAVTGAATGATTATAQAGGATTTSVAGTGVTKTGVGAPKAGIGKETLLHELAKERKSTNKTWIAVVGGLAAAVVLVSGFLFWRQQKNERAQQKSMAEMNQQAETIREQARQAQLEAASGLKQQLGLSPIDIVRQYGAATAKVRLQWRIYDQTTGRPVFHKTLRLAGVLVPVFVNNGEGIFPWLTLDDENRSNLPISESIEGSAFVVSEQGFLLTNKHVAAAWTQPYWCACYGKKGLLVTANAGRPTAINTIDLDADAYRSLHEWTPQSGGPIFHSGAPVTIGAYHIPKINKVERRDFVGRNDSLEVIFPNSRLGINGNLVRVSNDSDAALIKIDSPQTLQKVELAETNEVSVGERAVVLGYPSVAAKTYAISEVIERGVFKTNTEIVPQPYVTEGIVATVSRKLEVQRGGVTMGGAQGNVIQLTINATGPGNSGGPVFNAAGKVVGLFTYSFSSAGAHASGAVPIEYGRALFRTQ